MIITVYIGATADGQLLSALPSFAPTKPGVYDMDTSEMPDDLREAVEAEISGLMLPAKPAKGCQ